MARGAGLRLHFLPQGDDLLTPERLPIIVEFADGSLAVVRAIDADGRAMLAFAGEDGLENEMSADDLRAAVVHWAVERTARALRDVRVDTYIRPFEEHWLRCIVF